MEVKREEERVRIDCTADELAEILKDLWGHSMGMAEPGCELTRLARKVQIIPGLVNR